jgi:hypothetical protein
MGRICNTNGEKRNAYRILIGTPERKMYRWENNIKMGLRDIRCGGMDLFGVAQGR